MICKCFLPFCSHCVLCSCLAFPPHSAWIHALFCPLIPPPLLLVSPGSSSSPGLPHGLLASHLQKDWDWTTVQSANSSRWAFKNAHWIISPLCITLYKGSLFPWHNAKAPNGPCYLTLAYFTGCFFYHSPLDRHAGVTGIFFLKHTEFVFFPRPLHQLFLLPGVLFILFCTLLPLLSFRKLKYYPFREIFFEHKI